jgi:secreted trypsin-like serine protease
VGEVTLTNTRNQYTDGYNFQFSNSPGQGNGSGGTCFGDSGGPAFWGSTNVIAAVTSYGITKYCTGNSFSYRVDIADSLDFILPYLN